MPKASKKVKAGGRPSGRGGHIYQILSGLRLGLVSLDDTDPA
jgi:hypothetical protein